MKDINNTSLLPEMLHLRRQGKSNNEIANAVGVSVATVRNYIGNQPKGLTLKNRRATAANARNKRSAQTTEKPAEPIVHESFADRCKRLQNEAKQAKALSEIATELTGNKVMPGDAMKAVSADKIYNFGVPVEEKTPAPDATGPVNEPECVTPYTSYKEKANKSCAHELLTVFGVEAVKNYLRVALYCSGSPYVGYMTHDDLLAVLKILNKGEMIND